MCDVNKQACSVYEQAAQPVTAFSLLALHLNIYQSAKSGNSDAGWSQCITTFNIYIGAFNSINMYIWAFNHY